MREIMKYRQNFHEIATETDNLISLSGLPVALQFDFRLNNICVGFLFIHFLLGRVLFQRLFFVIKF